MSGELHYCASVVAAFSSDVAAAAAAEGTDDRVPLGCDLLATSEAGEGVGDADAAAADRNREEGQGPVLDGQDGSCDLNTVVAVGSAAGLTGSLAGEQSRYLSKLIYPQEGSNKP